MALIVDGSVEQVELLSHTVTRLVIRRPQNRYSPALVMEVEVMDCYRFH